jgi:Glycosyl transferase family 21
MLIYNKPVGTCCYMGGVMSVPEPFTWSWGNMIDYTNHYVASPGEMVHFDRVTSSYHATVRNEAATKFLGDWLLMLDTDHEFEPDLVARMRSTMEQGNLEVLSGLYRYKAPPYFGLAYRWQEDGKGFTPFPFDLNQPLVPIDCAGGGCLMVRRRVFDRIRNELGCQPFDIMHPLSEDFSFFKRCMDLGIKCWLAPQIQSWHLMYRQVTDKMHAQAMVG